MAPSVESPQASVRSTFVAVVAALVCVHASMAATRVTASLLVLHQGRPAWMVGALMSLFSVAPLGLALWAGRQADRHGLHRTLGIGVLMGFAGAALAVLSQHPVALALAALATGGAISVAAVGVQRQAGRMASHPADLKRVFSWVALGPALSNALAPVAVGLLIDHVSYRAGFVLAALLPLLAWWAARRVPREPVAAGAPTGVGAPAVAAGRRSAWDLLRHPSVRALIVVNLALSSCWDAHSFAIPVIGHAREMSASGIGLVLGGFATAATGVRLLISRWADRLDERRALRGAMVLATLTCGVYAWLPGLGGMLLGSAVLGLALGSVQPMVLAMLHQATPDDRQGEALGLRMLAVNLVTVVMPGLFGLLAEAVGPAAPLLLMGTVVLLARRALGPAFRT